MSCILICALLYYLQHKYLYLTAIVDLGQSNMYIVICQQNCHCASNQRYIYSRSTIKACLNVFKRVVN